MTSYLYLLQALLIAYILVMFRYSAYRGKFFLHMYQQSGYEPKEYRKWMKENWNSHVLTSTYAVFNLLLLIMLYFFRSKITLTSATLIICIAGISWFYSASTYRKKEKKPLVFTSRMYRQIVPFILLYAILPIYGTWMGYQTGTIVPDVYLIAFSWVMADILIPFFVLLGGLLMQPVEKLVQYGYIRKAKKKLASMPDLKIIAITGSYGKTSTKFMISGLLSERYNVCVTPGSYNTPMGICKVINNDLNVTHQILILEMGARYKGNIDELCRIAPPDIAVITNIGVAHLETFGSQEVIAKTKAEMLDYLPAGGTAVLNSDDSLIMNAVKRTDIQIFPAGMNSGKLFTDDIRYDENGTNFSIKTKNGDAIEVQMPLLGVHNVQNLLLAIGVGFQFDLRLQTMTVATSKLKPVEHRLELKKAGDYLVIDDAFNSNPVGARSAVDVLSKFKTGRRIIVTPGMVELGDAEEAENKAFGKYIGESNIDMVILVGEKQSRPILEGLELAGWPGSKLHVAESLFTANDFLTGFLKKGDVILYENDLPDSYV